MRLSKVDYLMFRRHKGRRSSIPYFHTPDLLVERYDPPYSYVSLVNGFELCDIVDGDKLGSQNTTRTNYERQKIIRYSPILLGDKPLNDTILYVKGDNGDTLVYDRHNGKKLITKNPYDWVWKLNTAAAYLGMGRDDLIDLIVSGRLGYYKSTVPLRRIRDGSGSPENPRESYGFLLQELNQFKK